MATPSDIKPDVPRLGVLRILKTLLEVENLFGPIFDEEIWFIGSISKVPSGERTWPRVGDVDISIVGEHMAEDFWRLLKALLERGIRPVWDVCEVPGDLVGLSKPCRTQKEHLLSLTLDCEKNTGTFESEENKQYNLDIKLAPTIVTQIPMSSKWMYQNNAQSRCNEPDVSALHEKFLKSDMVLRWPADIRFGDVLPLIERLF